MLGKSAWWLVPALLVALLLTPAPGAQGVQEFEAGLLVPSKLVGIDPDKSNTDSAKGYPDVDRARTPSALDRHYAGLAASVRLPFVNQFPPHFGWRESFLISRENTKYKPVPFLSLI